VTLDQKVSTAAPALIDAARMMQVFVNLIENAVQHSPRGQTVLVEVADAPVERGRATAIACTVYDRGTGLRPNDVPSIFNPFVSRRRGGVGMGLAIAHQIVRSHGGTLDAQNRGGGGAAFTVRLPASHTARKPERA